MTDASLEAFSVLMFTGITLAILYGWTRKKRDRMFTLFLVLWSGIAAFFWLVGAIPSTIEALFAGVGIPMQFHANEIATFPWYARLIVVTGVLWFFSTMVMTPLMLIRVIMAGETEGRR